MKSQDNKSESEQIKELIQLWLRHWYYFVAGMFVCGILGIVYIKTKVPILQVNAQVSLRHNESLSGTSIGSGSSMLSAFGLGNKSENIEDESIKMNSQGYIKQLAKAFNLNKIYTHSEFLGFAKKNLYDRSPVLLEVDESISDTISSFLNFSVQLKEGDKATVTLKVGRKRFGKYEITSFPAVTETPFGKFTFSKSEYYDNYQKPYNVKINYMNYDFITQIYRESLTVEYVKKNSDLINLIIPTDNVPLAKNMLNHLINIYNAEWDTDKKLVNDKTLTFIDERLELVKESLDHADKDIQDFKNKYNLTDIEADVTYYYTLSGELQPKLMEAKTQLVLANLIADFVKDEKNKYALIPYSLSTADPSFAEVINKYNEELIRRNELYKSSMQSSLAKSIDGQIELQRDNLLKSIDNVKKGLQISLKTLEAKEKEFDTKIGSIPAIEKGFIHLKREQEVQQTVYIFLLEMREESGVKGISLLPKLKVIDAPYALNKPLEPDLIKVAITILFFGGLAFPLTAIYLFPYIKLYIRRRKDA
jgi:uncharacterized protein involved in exopolysaccharide biosynthesis